MLQLVIDRSNMEGDLDDLTVVDDGSGTITLVPNSWQPATVQWAKRWATAPNVDGGSKTASRKEVTSMAAQFRILAADVDAAMAVADELGAALEQDEYTITETLGTRVKVYDCSEADWSIVYDGTEMPAGTALVTARIDVQP